MPKSVYKISDFRGGHITYYTPRDIPDEALSIASNVMVDMGGRIRLMGSAYVHRDFTQTTISTPVINPGSGLFALNHDYSFVSYTEINSIALVETIGTRYKMRIKMETSHQLDTGTVVTLSGTVTSGKHDGEFYIDKYDTDEFDIISKNNDLDAAGGGTEGRMSPGRGSFKSLLLSDKGNYCIIPEFGDIMTGWFEGGNSYNFFTLGLGANMGACTDHTSVALDDPSSWDTARLDYSYFFNGLRIFNTNSGDSLELGNLDKFDWPSWLGYIDNTWFTDVSGAAISPGTVSWIPNWYQTLSHPMSPLEWNSFRQFRNRHADPTSDTWASDNRAIQSFVYAYPSGDQTSTEAAIEAVEYTTALSNTVPTAGLTLLPGQFCVRMYTDLATPGAWEQGVIYKFGYSYYYDAPADGDRPQDSEIHIMGGWKTRAHGTTNAYLSTIQDGVLNLSGAGADSTGTNTFFNAVDDISVDMQVYINTGGSQNFTNTEDSTAGGAGEKPTRMFWPARMRGIRVWIVGTCDSSFNLIQEDEPLLLLDIDFEKGVRLNGSGQYTKYQALGSPAMDPDGNWNNTEQDNIVNTATLVSESPPTRAYSVLNERKNNQSFNAVKWKTDTVIGTTRYIGNFHADYGVSGYPHNFLDDDKRKLVRHPDSICRSISSGPDIFPEENIIPIGESNDGEEVVKLSSIGDQLLVWKTETLYIYVLSDSGEEFLQNSYKYMGVTNQSSVIKVEKGIAWLNKNGLFLYDGENIANVTDKKINPEEWSSFVGNNPVIGYIPTKKQILALKSSISESNTSMSYIYDVSSDAWTMGNKSFPNGVKSNLITNYDNSCMFATPNNDDVHEFTSAETDLEDFTVGGDGLWRISALGLNERWTNSKIQINSVDITDAFSYDGDEVGPFIISQINAKSSSVEGHQVFETNYDTEYGILTIKLPLSQHENTTFNPTNLSGMISVVNPPTGSKTALKTSREIYNFALFDPEAPDGQQAVFEDENGETQTVLLDEGNFIVTANHSLSPGSARLAPSVLKLFKFFQLADQGGDSLLDTAEGSYTVDYDLYGDVYSGLLSVWTNTLVGIKTEESLFNITTQMGMAAQDGATVTVPPCTFQDLFLGARGYIYFSDVRMARNFAPGQFFGISSLTGSLHNNYGNGRCEVLSVELLYIESQQVVRVEYLQFDANIVNEYVGIDETVYILFGGDSNAYTSSGLVVETLAVPSAGNGHQYYLKPNRHGDHNDLVTYVVDLQGNDGNSYQFYRTRASDEISKVTLDNLKLDMEQASVSTGTDIFLNTGMGDTTQFKYPSVSCAVDFVAAADTITTNSNTSLRAFQELLQPGMEFSITNAVDGANNANFVVESFDSSGSVDIITIDDGVDDCGGSITLSVLDETNDTVTITFHALLIQDNINSQHTLGVNTSVSAGASIYKFDNIEGDTDSKDIFIRTKDVDLGAPGVKKNLLSVIITASTLENVSINYYINGDTSSKYRLGLKSKGSKGGSLHKIYKFTPELDFNGLKPNLHIYSFMLEFESHMPLTSFSINDISIVYRTKGVR